ncbi:ring finger domain-containing protein [Hirsutella rhossiliensis]|uniref:Ring finger domain-containing protein n=1 Tax=Hirsutella rhossiliensis TaxID=111463 RepID=A0A9P8SHI7_9HYPO|nr:ring finger domain-containing protein [Hirsutella rhossiliensis]KAH0962209.1 ring finger domain-containing protein [Hirsutella rhossiliensis]
MEARLLAASPARWGRAPGSTWDNPIDLGSDDEPTRPQRRTPAKTAAQMLPSSSSGHAQARTSGASVAPCTPSHQKKRKAPAAAGDDEPSSAREKRLRRFRPQPPQSFHGVYARALDQRFCVLGRRRGGSDACPHETFALAGSTGNVYTVHVGREPLCNCPHAAKGNQCKHILYILARVLHAPFNLVYQLALLSSELRTIFANAPSTAGQRPDAATSSSDNGKGRRKPVEGDCPICFCELDAASPESIAWCRAGCGQNIHQQCFDTWAATKTAGGRVPCPLCRSEWPSRGRVVGGRPASRAVRLDEAVDSEGYANVASQLGISGVRDTSSYSDWHWRHSRRRGGW